MLVNVKGVVRPMVLRPYHRQADLLKAFAHPVRLQILDTLARGEACVCHLTTVLQKRQPYVSQQLMVLREAGLVQDRKDGVIVYYRLADDHIAALLSASRELLRGAGAPIHFPEPPSSPVAGCPCPKCVGDQGCS